MKVFPLKQRLLDKERELLSAIARLGGEVRAAGRPDVGDPVDAATTSESTSESVLESAAASETLLEVQNALRRIEDGTYGKCLSCGRDIEAARLEAIPWAQYCVKDQEKQDRAAHVPQGGATL